METPRKLPRHAGSDTLGVEDPAIWVLQAPQEVLMHTEAVRDSSAGRTLQCSEQLWKTRTPGPSVQILTPGLGLFKHSPGGSTVLPGLGTTAQALAF